MRVRKFALLFSFAISASAVLAQEADLAVEKLGPPEALAGSDVSYTLTVTNVGPDVASSVTLSDPIPAGMSFVSATQDSGPAFTCDSAVNCAIDTLPAGATATFTFVFHIDSGTAFLNMATVSSKTPDPNPENDSSSAYTVVGPPPQGDLYVQKSVPPGVAPDTDLTFTITLGNAGPSAATNVLLTDNLPAPLTFVSFTQLTGPAMTCGTSTCTIASFPAGATATFALVGHVPPTTPGGTEITNTATVQSDNDPLVENDSATATTVVSAADVSLVKAGPASAAAGSTVTYTVTVTNAGPDAALNVVVLDPQICAYVSCSLGTMAPGAVVILNATVTIPSNATSWSNTATVTTDSVDPNSANNTDTVATTITQEADVSVAKTGDATVVAGNEVTYTITVTNNGPSDASNVVLTDTLPAGTTFVSSSCGANPCAIGTLAANASYVVTIVANVPATTTGTITNSATVSSSTSDPAGGNNTVTFDTAVTPAPADLSIAKTAGDSNPFVGANVIYTIVVTNLGPGPANNVVMTDILPAGTTFVSASAGCTGTTTITCTIGTLAANASSTITLELTMPATTGIVSNTATVSSTTSDPANGNDSATSLVAVGPEPADLSITKTTTGADFAVGQNVTYTIVVTNNGPATATDVVVTDTLPPGSTLVSSSCGANPCNAGSLAAGASATITLVVTMPATPGPVTNSASVASSTPDITPANDAASVVVEAHIPGHGIPTLSPLALALFAIAIASVVLVVLRRAS